MEPAGTPTPGPRHSACHGPPSSSRAPCSRHPEQLAGPPLSERQGPGWEGGSAQAAETRVGVPGEVTELQHPRRRCQCPLPAAPCGSAGTGDSGNPAEDVLTASRAARLGLRAATGQASEGRPLSPQATVIQPGLSPCSPLLRAPPLLFCPGGFHVPSGQRDLSSGLGIQGPHDQAKSYPHDSSHPCSPAGSTPGKVSFPSCPRLPSQRGLDLHRTVCGLGEFPTSHPRTVPDGRTGHRGQLPLPGIVTAGRDVSFH